jgi:hypothetical protein
MTGFPRALWELDEAQGYCRVRGHTRSHRGDCGGYDSSRELSRRKRVR